MFHRKQVPPLALVLAGAVAALHAQGRVVQVPPGAWRDAPEYVRLFAPARAHTSSYHAYVSPGSLQAVLGELEVDRSLLRPPGAWAPAALLFQDAFGKTGNYQAWKMARLFGARRALVARGPRGAGGRATEAWTLISPYPDPELQHLEPGTLLIVLDLNP